MIANNNEELTYVWIFICGSALSLIACLIYNEIIILYFCDLGRETKKMIIERSDKECHVSELGGLIENMRID